MFAIANVIFSQNSPFRISFSRSASPYGNIDHNRLTYTLRPHQPQPPRLHSTATSTTTAPLHPTATLTTARNFAQQSRLNSSAENFSYFFKKALDKYPKTVYNVYCYLGVAQIGSALPWGGRGRRFKSCHSDHKSTVILIELRWAFSIPENRLESGFSAVQAHKRTPLQAIPRRGFVHFMVDMAFCAIVIVKRLR